MGKSFIFVKSAFAWLVNKLNLRFIVLLFETLLPIVFGLLTFFISEEAITLYNKFLTHIVAGQQIIPLTNFEWAIVTAVPLSAIGWMLTIFYRYNEFGKELQLDLSKRNLEVAEQKIELYELNIKSLVNGFIYTISKDLGLTNEDRITIYSHSATKGFIIFGRHSFNMTYNEKHRVSFSDSEGVISKAWNVGHHFDNQIPAPSDLNKYTSYQLEHYKIPKMVSRNMKMKSLMIFGWSVINHNSQAPIAVIVVESTIQNKFSEKQLLDYFEEKRKLIKQFIGNISPFLPHAGDKITFGF